VLLQCSARFAEGEPLPDFSLFPVRCAARSRRARQDDLPADLDVLRTINADTDHCLGVYASVVEAGTLTERDRLEFESSVAASARATVARASTMALKRGLLRGVDALMPRGR
jgi:hypothetical protein